MNHEKIIKTILLKFKLSRESKKLSCMTMSTKLSYSTSVYRQIERGESRLKMDDYFLICGILEIEPVGLLYDAFEAAGGVA